jgi:hypothetical protein
MTHLIPFDELLRGIQTIYKSDPSRAEGLMEKYLEQKLKGFLPAERMTILEELALRFENVGPQTRANLSPLPEEFTRFFSLLLGHQISSQDLSSSLFWEKFASSLNTIFDTLNQIVGVIHANLLGQRTALETIRQIIGSSWEKEGKPESLQGYLDQIREAFLVSHRAFQQAALNQMRAVLAELEPERLEAEGEGGLKFGPFLKAELFEAYKQRFKKVLSWFDSGRFREELLREFEKNCQKFLKEKTGGPP